MASAQEATLELVGMPIPVFHVGPIQQPPIRHDDGHLGQFPPRQATAADYAQLAAWIARLEVGEAIQGLPFLPKNDLPDALAAYRHFLFGKGRDRTFHYERYVQNDPSGRDTLANAIAQAQDAAEELFWMRRNKPTGSNFHMVSSAIPCGTDPDESPWGHLYPYPETENWQKAIGAHYLWLSAQVMASTVVGRTTFAMHLVCHVEDRYNFNPGSEDMQPAYPMKRTDDSSWLDSGFNTRTTRLSLAWCGGRQRSLGRRIQR